MEKEYNRSPQEVLEELGSCPTGLTDAEAAERLAKHGPNKLKEAEKPSVFQRFLTQLKDPMLLILIAAAAVSAVTNALSNESFTEVFIILVVVLLNAVLGVVQESKAEAAIEALQTMTAAKCKVLRDGHQVVIESSQLVPGDVVLLESPSYLGAVNAFKACEPKFIEVPTDDGGMIMDELEKILATTERVKMIYVIPDFQNPTGRTWDLDRRHKFMEIVNRYEIPVIEDNPYGELRFEGEYMPALKSLDTKGLVIYLGTFSKILAPGYRLGWVCADDAILAKYNFMEQAASLQASTIGQMETSKWIDMFDLDAHVNTIRECYRKRRAVMLETLAKELPEPCTFTRPDGGLFAWVVLPEYMDAKDLQMKCLEKKVAFVPGGSFFPNGGHDNTLRLNYSCMPEDKIVKGITALCQTIRENLR